MAKQTAVDKALAAKKRADIMVAAGHNIPQVASANPVALIQPDNLPGGIVLVRRVTMPALAMKTAGQQYVLRLEDRFRESKVEGKINPETKEKEKPATICGATDVITGVCYTLLVPAVVRKNLEQDYADGGYVGKVFMIVNRGKRTASQRYYDFDIAEVSVTPKAAESGASGVAVG